MNSARLSWSNLDKAYTDEFGVIHPEVYHAASELWPQAENLTDATLRDRPMGLQLMLKAAANVSRIQQEDPNQIRDLKAYLWIAFKRLLSDELEEQNRFQSLDADSQTPFGDSPPDEILNSQILLQQVITRMDAWTRKVFELRLLGYQFEEIAQLLLMRPNHLRSKFHKEIDKLRRHFNK